VGLNDTLSDELWPSSGDGSIGPITHLDIVEDSIPLRKIKKKRQ
jgi:hypothetical protein